MGKSGKGDRLEVIGLDARVMLKWMNDKVGEGEPV
jgi:hypothetical protein